MDHRKLAQDAHKAQNQVRTNPQSFIPKLEAMLPLFQGDVYRAPGKIALRTNEGPSAVKECIEFLRNAKPVHELTLSEGMSNACSDHANDIGPKNMVSHSGTDGSSFSKRLERYGDWMGTVGENCEFGGETGEEVIINLMVDDGVSNRGHRKNMFSPDFKFVGIACAHHGAYDHCTVLDYAAQYGPKGSKQQGGNFGTGSFPSYTTSFSQPTQSFSSQPTQSFTSNYQPTNSFSSGYGAPQTNPNLNYAPPMEQQNVNINFAPSYEKQPSTQSYGQPTQSYGQPTQSYGQPTQSSYNTGSYGAPTNNTGSYGAPTSNTYTTHTTNQGPYGNEKVHTTYTTKSFGDHDLFNDPRISEQLSKMRIGSDFSTGNLRDTAQKEAPPGAIGWSTNSNISIINGQKISKITTVYKFADGSTKEVTKEVVEKSC